MIFFDTETTGLLMPEPTEIHLQPYIVEFYGCRLDDDFNMIDELATFIKPPLPIPEETIRVHGITDQMVAKAPTFIQVYDRLCEFFLGETIFIAHNLSFDAGMLRVELQRHDLEYHFPWPSEWICTVEKSYPIMNKRLRLKHLHELATGAPHENAHRAKDDVFALVRSFQWMKKQSLV